MADLNSEISAASQEQANGIEQISKAMNQLDQAIQSNAASSEQVASSASEMSNQAECLSGLVFDLNRFINGMTSDHQKKTQNNGHVNNNTTLKFPKKSKAKSQAAGTLKMTPAQSFPLDEKESEIGKAEGF